jgi:hypothetical protein
MGILSYITVKLYDGEMMMNPFGTTFYGARCGAKVFSTHYGQYLAFRANASMIMTEPSL